MTVYELEFSPIARSAENPYAVHPYSEEILGLTKGLTGSGYPAFMDANTNPDMATDSHIFKTYLLEAEDGAADIARAIEGHVISEEWRVSHDEVQAGSQAVEGNSLFFLVVDVTDPENPRPAASLSVANCSNNEPSETRQTFIDNYGDELVPSELRANVVDSAMGLWDVMAVMAPREYRGTNAATWAYSALYRASQVFSVSRWIANMTDKEFRTLDTLGIPFEVIPGTPKIQKERPGKSPILSGFHTIQVDQIRASMTAKIEQLEALAKSDNPNWQIFANMARIAMDGSLSGNTKQAAA